MYQKFNNLESEKKERIINVALKEFARNGYEKASTNEIIKEAQISKGSLFNYFNSKKELYLFLIDYVGEVIQSIYKEVDWSETDLFRRMKAIGLVKFKTYKRYPQVFDFMDSVSNEDASEVKGEIEKIRKNTLESGFEIIYKNIDWSKFRSDLDIQKVLDIIDWTIIGFSEEQRKRINSIEDIGTEVLDEWDEYFDILKCCFYKKENQ